MQKKIIAIILVASFVLGFSFNPAEAANLSNQLKGRLLLQVESKGEIWYVNPQDNQRYEVTISNSLPLFRKLSLGISSADLNKIPLPHQSFSRDFGLSLKGKFLLDVENKGRIWYVDLDGFRHEIKQDNLINIFQNLSLGISDQNLLEIPIGSLEDTISKPQANTNNTRETNLDSADLQNDPYFQSFWELWTLVQNRYAGIDISSAELFEGAKKGLIEALGDDYSTFMDEEESDEFLDELSGQFEGIGAEISIKNNYLTVVAPLPGMPAEDAGILAGDIILEIDGVSTEGMTLNQAVSLIKGESGTPVVLKIRHQDQSEENITVIRGSITYASLSYELRKDNIAYIRMIRFNSDASSLFQETAKTILSQDVDAIILDLRNNPGGFMSASIDVAGYWTGPVNIVTEKYKNEDRIDQHISNKEAVLGQIPTVVLVNEGSASASEIVAGALQDYGSAIIVGEKTFGKGSVQELKRLSDGAYIKLTIAKWYTPRGNSIDGKGIIPDILVENILADYIKGIDNQLERAVKLIK
jgi:carboxyl-terminal processing protease